VQCMLSVESSYFFYLAANAWKTLLARRFSHQLNFNVQKDGWGILTSGVDILSQILLASVVGSVRWSSFATKR
jgi:hypothetical protein